MQDRGMQVKVGLLVLVSAALFVAFIIILGDFSAKPGITIFADFDTSADLKVGAPVKIAGVTAGKVREVRIQEEPPIDNTSRITVRVRLEVDADKAEFIRPDAEAYITTLGFLGEKYVEIEPGRDVSGQLSDGGMIRGNAPVRLEIVMANIARLLEDITGTLDRNKDVIDSTLATVNATVIDIHSLVAELGPDVRIVADQAMTLLNKLALILENAEKLAQTAVTTIGDGSKVTNAISNIENITAQLNSRVNPTMNRVDDVLGGVHQLAEQYRQIGAENREKILGVVGRLESAVTMAEEVTRMVRQGRGAVGALLGDQDLYDDFKELIEDIKRHPWKIIWKE